MPSAPVDTMTRHASQLLTPPDSQSRVPSPEPPVSSPHCIHCGPAGKPRPVLTIWQPRPIRFFRCRRCHLVFKDPAVYRAEEEFGFAARVAGNTEPSLDAFQETFHTAGEISDAAGELYPSCGYDQQELVAGIFDGIDRRIRQHTTIAPGDRFRLLEVGCATGFLLRRFRQAYPNAELAGIDPSPFSVRKAQSVDGVDVKCGTLDTVSPPAGSFDVVVMIGNFQLHRDPRATLAAAHRALKPGGLLIFDTKNPASWFRIVGRVLSRTWPLNRLRAVRRMVSASHVGMRYGIPKRLLRQWLASQQFEVLELTGKDLRLFQFNNPRAVSRGVLGATLGAMNLLDAVRDQRAWLDVCCRKRA